MVIFHLPRFDPSANQPTPTTTNNNTMKDIQMATLNARQRTGDKSIGTRVKQGKFQIVRVEYAKNGKSTVTELSGWLAGYELIPALNALSML